VQPEITSHRIVQRHGLFLTNFFHNLGRAGVGVSSPVLAQRES
jgi:hypothetical protein